MKRFVVAAVLLLALTGHGAERASPITIEGKLVSESPAVAGDVVIAVRVWCKEGSHAFRFGSEPQVFGIYVLGPWGPVQPDLAKVRPENWMHQQHSAATRIVITPDKPFEAKLRLADYFPVKDAAAFRTGRYQVNVKFYEAGLGMPRPADTGAMTFDLSAAERTAR
jgi:hypothetical protein